MIEVRDLKKKFGAQPILYGVTFRIETGESAVIIGRSGGGKSVLLKHLIGLLKPDSGEVLVDNQSIVSMNERAWAKADANTNQARFYFDLRRHQASAKTGQTPWTPSAGVV